MRRDDFEGELLIPAGFPARSFAITCKSIMHAGQVFERTRRSEKVREEKATGKGRRVVVRW